MGRGGCKFHGGNPRTAPGPKGQAAFDSHGENLRPPRPLPPPPVPHQCLRPVLTPAAPSCPSSEPGPIALPAASWPTTATPRAAWADKVRRDRCWAAAFVPPARCRSPPRGAARVPQQIPLWPRGKESRRVPCATQGASSRSRRARTATSRSSSGEAAAPRALPSQLAWTRRPSRLLSAAAPPARSFRRTPELHARFVEAVERCGGHKNATPKQVGPPPQRRRAAARGHRAGAAWPLPARGGGREVCLEGPPPLPLPTPAPVPALTLLTAHPARPFPLVPPSPPPPPCRSRCT